jgi:ABC-type glycerol-3-phosphate transport system permease component
MPCAGGGKGRPRPLRSRPGACAPWNPDLMHASAERLAHMPAGNWMQELMNGVSVSQRHAPMWRLGGKHYLQGVWLAHAGFGLPLATYLLFNYISELPRDILESAFIDGASPFTTFTRLILPLSMPALAAFAIFQFLWVWNDYLVALIFIGSAPKVQVLTMRLVEMVGTRGQDWHLLTAGAFISMLLPLIVFFSLQRFFVRGLLAGSVKG